MHPLQAACPPDPIFRWLGDVDQDLAIYEVQQTQDILASRFETMARIADGDAAGIQKLLPRDKHLLGVILLAVWKDICARKTLL